MWESVWRCDNNECPYETWECMEIAHPITGMPHGKPCLGCSQRMTLVKYKDLRPKAKKPRKRFNAQQLSLF